MLWHRGLCSNKCYWYWNGGISEPENPTSPTYCQQQYTHPELKSPPLLHLWEPSRTKFSTLIQAAKIVKPHQFGRISKHTLYKDLNNL